MFRQIKLTEVMFSAGGASVSIMPVGIPAAIRAKWLAETAEALAHARGILEQIKPGDCDDATFAELLLRIGAASHEVDLLRGGRPTREEHHPKWSSLAPWDEARPSI